MACILDEHKSSSRKKCGHADGNPRHREDDDERLRLLDTGGDEHDVEIEVLRKKREGGLERIGDETKGNEEKWEEGRCLPLNCPSFLLSP